MGGKSSQSTQQITIPPEVLARYNSVNATAEQAASRPFQQYSTDPNAFVAPLTGTQQAGIANTNYYAGTAQPYYAQATQQLMGAQGAAVPYYAQATQGTQQAQDIGSQLAGLSMGSLYGGQAAAARPQQQAQQAYRQAYTGAAPFQDIASQYMTAGTQAVNPQALGAEQIGQYMSPYLGNVLGSTAALQNQMNQQAMSGQTGNAIRQGAFGGDRAGIAAANLAQQQQMANAKTFSDILNTGYGQALSTAQGQQQLGLGAAQANRAALQQATGQALGIGQQGYTQGIGYGQAQQGLGQQLFGQGATTAQQQAALGQQQFGQGLSAAQQQAALGQGLYGMGAATAQQLAALGQGAQGSGLQGAQAQLAAGQAQQQTQQAGLQALYNQFLQQQSYPFQVAQFLANIAEGTGALSGSTTTTNQAMGGFSDKRLKENIKPIGKTFDGQNIYSYNFKGEPQTEIGLIAQEVEKHHPEAVGLAGGYKTVRYDKATDDAAERGHFASGGAASMGGGVMPQHEGQGFYDGGFVGFDPGLMQQIMSSYQQMYAPMGNEKGGLGAAGYVPAAAAPVGSLQTAGALPEMQSPMANAKGMADAASSIGQLGDRAGMWKFGSEDKKKPDDNTQDKGVISPDTLSSLGLKSGGRAGLAAGGMPYAQDSDPAKLGIPDEREKHELMTAGKVNGPSGGGIGDTANTISSVIGTGMKIASLFSDKRMKENLKPVGKTFDGQTVYSYNYKGDHQTRMGLIAQEVEHHHPHAVGEAQGMKTVDYKKATGLAAKRGHFAEGGEADDLDSNPIMKRLLGQLNPFETEDEEHSAELNKPHEATGLMPKAMDFSLREKTPKVAAAPTMDGAMAHSGKVDPEIVSFFMGKGLTEGQALGIAAGITAESGSNPAAMNEQSGAMGLGQWLGPRKAGIVKQFGPKPSKGQQLEYLWGELTGGDRGGASVLAERDPKSVLGAYITKFMRPAAGHETESDIARGHSALGYADGGLAGARHGYATDGSVDDPENILPDAYNPVSPDEAAQIGADATSRKAVDPTNFARMVKSLPEGEARNQFFGLMQQKGIGVENPDAPTPTGLAAATAAPQAPRSRPALGNGQPDRGFFGNIAHGDFVSGLGKGKAESWIPLLTGLGTWATTPTRSALSGILAGTAAGAQAAQAQREFGMKGRQVAAVESEAVSDRLRANASVLQSETAGATEVGRAMQQTVAQIAMARMHGGDPKLISQLGQQLNDLTRRRDALLSGGQGAPGAPAAITSPTAAPIASSIPYDPSNPASVLGMADVQTLGGIQLPSVTARADLAREGITLGEKGDYGNIPSYGPAKGSVTATAQIPQMQVERNVKTADQIRTDYEQFRDAAPIVQAMPHALTQQPTPQYVRDLQTQLAGVLGMSPQQAASSFGTTYDAASLVPVAGALGITIDPSNPVMAINTLLDALHKRFDNLGMKYQAIQDIANVAKARGLSPYDPQLDYPALISQRVYGKK